MPHYLPTPTPRSRDDARGSVPEVGERTATLPTAPDLEHPVRTVPPPAEPAAEPGEGERASEPVERPRRESILAGLRQRRTTLLEVGEIAHRLSMLPPWRAEASRVRRQAALSLAFGLTLALLGTMVFVGGGLRLALGILGGTAATTLVVFGTLHLVSTLAKRHGARELPGPALLWVGGLAALAAAATLTATYSVSEVTKPLALPPRPRPLPSASASAAEPVVGRADARVKRGMQLMLGRGVLFVPPAFAAPDGKFDLLVHYHGNVELVKASAVAAQLNALVHVVNYGDGSGRYSEPLRNPSAFDTMLDGVERRAAELGLERPRIRRIALVSWSAGYGALYYILNSRSRLERVDALFLLDSLHASFAPGSKSVVAGISIAPFVAFAHRAVDGEKLMVLTHSAVQTVDYPNTTQSADALLERLHLARTPVADGSASPPASKLPVAVAAFPSGERNWLRVRSVARQGELTVLGCDGDGKGDHIAHLAQMADTVLVPLARRWTAPAP